MKPYKLEEGLHKLQINNVVETRVAKYLNPLIHILLIVVAGQWNAVDMNKSSCL